MPSTGPKEPPCVNCGHDKDFHELEEDNSYCTGGIETGTRCKCLTYRPLIKEYEECA